MKKNLFGHFHGYFLLLLFWFLCDFVRTFYQSIARWIHVHKAKVKRFKAFFQFQLAIWWTECKAMDCKVKWRKAKSLNKIGLDFIELLTRKKLGWDALNRQICSKIHSILQVNHNVRFFHFNLDADNLPKYFS